jgi:hypothetical protein
MSVSCGRFIDALWCNEQASNAWVWLRGTGWRKLDDRNSDACTDLLAIASEAKANGWQVSVHEEQRAGNWVITEMYSFPDGALGPTQEISNSVSECVYSWTSAYAQRGTDITVRIRLDFDSGISAATQTTLMNTWRTGIETKWSGHFGCCTSPGCIGRCVLNFHVEWVTSGEHHRVRVRVGPARSSMTLWDTSDTGDVASHECGHMLGWPDEYSDTACPSRTPVNTGTVMDDNTEVVQRLCQPFCDRHGLNTYQV